jgi:hypothetical protein
MTNVQIDEPGWWADPSSGRLLRGLAVGLAAAMQVVVLVPFTVASGLVSPLWAIVALYALWLAAGVVLVRTARRRPFAAPLVPVINAALLWLAVSGGESLLGWTA